MENRIDIGWLDQTIKEGGIKIVPSAESEHQAASGAGRTSLLGNDNFTVTPCTAFVGAKETHLAAYQGRRV